ncbi:mevalonate kinase [Candidatus Roizmanbacteria bacterium RIFCSPLOWO2_02_FULL_37_19]|uniref:Mevalonate kinase n=1 Tax=Candidatus Roizmanbacteria bacterium RIFCSPHIGHO2_02_FULL_37_24 TaxID=1802037 RepID=A0A1F7H0Y3_9BACT|nr:MAG: mevalonate kinase [Candidatus Roizmanbacteria bacterium RIFCSPHIGHO2_01_FULL_38_41]OGK24506.1 MAG: mevalonate kinase [Candidatus Roizmanbacteria bacterium RIFCSPHIGHO2_02_FULL_37_24]OGK31960.1 MAG: mevalonate kinase [Candidatus Roizmanbacteria bacterium RIFCSPHIGHO2_12_FULL_37_23]OGK43762.1 MAG: mevalonate kinase [Candidatus Roizmanbacteria bacterium RIFCSPLOWO2_01_FULL_37_57]OGK54315.1 MAG: mevalonate kinase [Candidatus Roizmanbacteria bacterium RIFCSPLOWO2_02_FULL_37_19]OGK61870.1 MA
MERSTENLIKVSAPGKLMLLGEHAVVYGHPCIVTAVNKRVHAYVEHIDSPNDIVDAPQAKNPRFVLETIHHMKKKFGIRTFVKVRTNGDFSNGIGLGSSSAVTVATCAALNTLWNLSLSQREIFDISYKVVLSVQRVGSGFDTAAATFGGTLYYVRGGEVIDHIKIGTLPLVVGYTREKANTAKIIKNVAKKYQREKKKIDNLFKHITQLVNKGRRELENNNLKEFGKLMIEDHFVLKELGVSTGRLDNLVNASIRAGSFGAKLSGAGGGDIMIALTSESNRKSVEKAIEEAGGEVIKVETGIEGVISHN